MKALVTKSFASQAIAFPDKVDQALAEVSMVEGAKDLLDKAAAMQKYAERLKVGVEVGKPIAFGVLKIKAKLGELMPRGKGGRGNKLSQQMGEFHANTITAYPNFPTKSRKYRVFKGGEREVVTTFPFGLFSAAGVVGDRGESVGGRLAWRGNVCEFRCRCELAG